MAKISGYKLTKSTDKNNKTKGKNKTDGQHKATKHANAKAQKNDGNAHYAVVFSID